MCKASSSTSIVYEATHEIALGVRTPPSHATTLKKKSDRSFTGSLRNAFEPAVHPPSLSRRVCCVHHDTISLFFSAFPSEIFGRRGAAARNLRMGANDSNEWTTRPNPQRAPRRVFAARILPRIVGHSQAPTGTGWGWGPLAGQAPAATMGALERARCAPARGARAQPQTQPIPSLVWMETLVARRGSNGGDLIAAITCGQKDCLFPPSPPTPPLLPFIR